MNIEDSVYIGHLLWCYGVRQSSTRGRWGYLHIEQCFSSPSRHQADIYCRPLLL